jgi:Sec-independent protein translocase protein TatA
MNQPLLAFGMPSGLDMIVIGILVLVLFGANHLPIFGRSFRRRIDLFRQTKDELENQLDRHWHFRRPDESSRHASPNIPVILFVTAIVVLFVALIAQLPH